MLTNIKLLTNKQTTVSVHDLINRKGYESYFNPFNNNLKFDVEYLGKLEGNKSAFAKLQSLYKKIENKEVY